MFSRYPFILRTFLYGFLFASGFSIKAAETSTTSHLTPPIYEILYRPHRGGVESVEEKVFFVAITNINQTHIITDEQGDSQTFPLEHVIKIRNLASNPYQQENSADTSESMAIAYQRSSIPQVLKGSNERRLAEMMQKLQSEEQPAQKIFPDNVTLLKLQDGSRWAASSLMIESDQVLCQLLGLPNDLSCPIEEIISVRFAVSSLHDMVNPPPDWESLSIPSNDGDKIIVGNAGAFDVYSGILHGISEETISFAVDSDVLPLPRRKVFGLVLHGNRVRPNTAAASPAVVGTVALWSGTTINITGMQLAEEKLTLKTVTGISVTVPFDEVSEITLHEQGVVYLTDMEPARSEFSLPFDAKPFNTPALSAAFPIFQTFYENRRKKRFAAIMLEGQSYERSILLRGKALLEYSLPMPYASLSMVFGVEDQYRPYVRANVRILADSQILGSWEIRGDQAAQRIRLKLPQGCRSITLLSEPVPHSDCPAILTVAEPKLYE